MVFVDKEVRKHQPKKGVAWTKFGESEGDMVRVVYCFCLFVAKVGFMAK